jgi:phenylacetate-CoA ligase
MRDVQIFRARERWTAAEWAVWRRQAIADALGAASQAPYYRDHWTLADRKAASAGRLTELPKLEKDAIRQSPDAFIPETIRPRPSLMFETSGSTGTPIKTYWTARELRTSMAVREVRSCGWAGVSFRAPRATFSGRLVEPRPHASGPFYRLNVMESQVYFSAFHLRPDTVHHYVDALRRHGIRWLTGYAFSFYTMASLMLERGLSVSGIAAVITTSEKLTTAMRQVISRAFGCSVWEEYGTVENALFASECEHGRLHVSPEIGEIEILRTDGTPCEPDEVGEVVATCLFRLSQPFIRYRLGDLAAWDSAPCPCGRELPVIKEVVGRLEDAVIGRDGRRLVRFHSLFVNQPHVREGQVIQESLERVRVRVVPTSGFSLTDAHEIQQRVRQRLGPDVDVPVECVAVIPRTSAGKFRAVVSLIDAADVTSRHT